MEVKLWFSAEVDGVMKEYGPVDFGPGDCMYDVLWEGGLAADFKDQHGGPWDELFDQVHLVKSEGAEAFKEEFRNTIWGMDECVSYVEDYGEAGLCALSNVHGNMSEAQDDMERLYQGSYNTPSDWARGYFDWDEIPDEYRAYVDVERFADDHCYTYPDSTGGVHVFLLEN